MPTRLKEKLYRTAIRPSMAYGTEYWLIKKQHMHKMDVVERRMMMWMCSKTMKDKIRNEYFLEHLEVATIGDKIRETRLRWFGHIQRRPATAPVRKSLAMKVDGSPRGMGRPKRTWMKVVKIDMKKCNLSEDLAKDKLEWKNKIRVVPT